MTLDEMRALAPDPFSYDLEYDGEDHELEQVVRLLRAESSHAYLCGHEERSEWLDSLVARLESHEHRS